MNCPGHVVDVLGVESRDGDSAVGDDVDAVLLPQDGGVLLGESLAMKVTE